MVGRVKKSNKKNNKKQKTKSPIKNASGERQIKRKIV